MSWGRQLPPTGRVSVPIELVQAVLDGRHNPGPGNASHAVRDDAATALGRAAGMVPPEVEPPEPEGVP